MGYIVALLLFRSGQSTHDIFCHFPQWSYDCRGALCCQTDLHLSFPHLSLVLGYHLIVGGSHSGVLLIVVVCCQVQWSGYLSELLWTDAQNLWVVLRMVLWSSGSVVLVTSVFVDCRAVVGLVSPSMSGS